MALQECFRIRQEDSCSEVEYCEWYGSCAGNTFLKHPLFQGLMGGAAFLPNTLANSIQWTA